jgi:ABC-type transport system involved in cytochrome bd biosynthesis fused ATPase/permease subunit
MRCSSSAPGTRSAVWLVVSLTAIGDHGRVETAAAILLGVFLLLTVLVVLGLFVWAARKDGEEDRAVQKRLGIRRKTRLGP